MAIIKYFKIFWRFNRQDAHRILLGVMLAIVANLCNLSTPFLTRFLVDEVIGAQKAEYLEIVLLIAVCVIAVLFSFSLVSNYILYRVFRRNGLMFRTDLLKNIQQAPIGFFGETSSGQISYRVLNDTQVIEDSWSQYIVAIPYQSMMLSAGVFMLMWQREMALVVFALLAIQVVIIAKFRGPLLRLSQQRKQMEQDVSGFTVERLKKIQLSRSLMTEKKELLGFVRKFHNVIKVSVRAFMLGKFSGVAVTVVNNLWAFGILWYGGRQVVAGNMTLGTLMAFLLFANILFQPISAITSVVLNFQIVRASLERILEYLSIASPVQDSPHARDITPHSGGIELRDVSFAYNSRPILKQVNMKVETNSIFALVGKSGEGKTTLCRLLARFIDADDGDILLDNVNTRDYSVRSLRRSILYMSQNDYVIEGSIWDNLTYGLKRGVERDAVQRAVEEVGLDFITHLPDGYLTKIGENGINISVGEAQRIALARAILISPKVLILDEPTAFIDGTTESRILDALLRMKEKCTIILVAHRPSTVSIADRVGVMKNGTIVACGTRENLEKNCEVYRGIQLTASGGRP